MEEDIMQIAKEMVLLSNMAVTRYNSMTEDVLSGRIVDEQDIARIMDGMLDFCWSEEMLLLFKRLCRGLYPMYPQLVQDYISYYREMWEDN